MVFFVQYLRNEVTLRGSPAFKYSLNGCFPVKNNAHPNIHV